MDVVVAGEQERHAPRKGLVTQVLDGGDRLGPRGELGPVGLDELGPGHLSAVKDAAQIGGRGGVLGPLIEVGTFLGHASGPEPVHQDPCSVLGVGLLADAFEHHVVRRRELLAHAFDATRFC